MKYKSSRYNLPTTMSYIHKDILSDMSYTVDPYEIIIRDHMLYMWGELGEWITGDFKGSFVEVTGLCDNSWSPYKLHGYYITVGTDLFRKCCELNGLDPRTESFRDGSKINAHVIRIQYEFLSRMIRDSFVFVLQDMGKDDEDE